MARNFGASLMRGFGGSTLRGGQTVFHSIRMWGQLFQAAMLFAAFMTVAVPAWNLWNRTTGAEWYAAGMFTLAEFKLTVGYAPDSGQEIRFADGTAGVMKIRDIVASMPAWRARERIKAEMFRSAWLGAKVGAGIIALFLVWFWYRGVQLSRRKRIRGAELVTAGELRRRMRPAHLRVLDRMPGAARLRPYSIAGIPYPERTETQHTIVSGTTGSGKTVLIADLVSQIRARGERCVIYDKMGSYTRSFFDPARDVLMNPLDARAPRWSPFLEARNPRDFDMMAAALIPQQKDTVDPFWVTAARQLFSNGAGVFWKQGVTENKVLVDHLLKTDLTALAKAMEGTVAQSIVDPENPKTALSVRAMLTAHLGALEFLPDEGKPFSIRDWIGKEDKDGFLFLTSRGDQHASLRGLISTWLEIAVNAMLTLAQDDGRRIWVILDELPTLHQVPSLQPGLAESRQFGGCFVLGVQVAAALRDLYGRNGAETISGLCGTRVVLAAPDRDTAQWSADSLGRSEVEEVAEGYSYGANTIRDGVSLTPKRELRALALPSEIMRLPNLEGYLKFPGPFPVASIRLKYVARGAKRRRGSCRGKTVAPSAPMSRIPGRMQPLRKSRTAIEQWRWPVCRRTCFPGRASSTWPCRRKNGGAPWNGTTPRHRGPPWKPGTTRRPSPDGSNPVGRCRSRRRNRAARPRPRNHRRGQPGRTPPRDLARRATGSDMLSIGALTSAAQGASYYERDGYYAKDDPEHRAASAWAGKGAEELGLKGPVDPDTFRAILEGRVPDGSDTRLGRRGKDGERPPAPPRPRPHLLRSEIRIHRSAGRRRRPDHRGPRPRRGGDAGLDREERRRDPHEGPGDREYGARRGTENRRRHLPPRHLAQPRSPTPLPCCARQHGAGRGREMALDGQRGAIRAAEADRHALPQRACRRSCAARLWHREDPFRRALRDRRGVAGHD